MSRKLNAIIIDDEEFARENLKMIIDDFCEEVNVVGMAASAKDARKLVDEVNPDLVFLDIMMPGEDGFSFLQSLEGRSFQVIFTTAFREYALKAIKESAIDYLEKPIDIDELKKAVQKAAKVLEEKKSTIFSEDRITKILQEIALTNSVEKTVIPTRDGLAVVKNTDIIHLEADENYTTLYCVGGKKYVSSKSIKAFEDKLDPNMFFRVHKSHIINIAHHLKEFNRTDGNIAVLSDGKQVPVARRKLQEFLDKLEHMG
ncbi:MAG: LytR/AlgR family response regulator transcription factor [Flavobacteriales bacterium]|jgi:two-component system LytT family response regulator